MRTPRGPRGLILPSRRLAAAFAVGSCWFFAVPWGGGGLMWLGAGWVGFLIVMTAIDFVWLRDSRHCSPARDSQTVLSLGEPNPIWLEVSHGGSRRLGVTLQDDAPIEFHFKSSSAHIDIRPGETRRANYKVMPDRKSVV